MRATEKLTDREVLQKAAKDQGYLPILVQRYRIPLYNFVFRFVGDRETAEDVVQETFLRCLRHSHQFPAIEQVSTWLYTIAGNLAKTELRRRKRWHWIPIGPSEEEERSAFYEPVDGGQLPGEQTDTHQVKDTVVEAIHQLPDEFREAVLLRDLNGLSYEEIAKIINCPVGTVKSRVNRGRLRLQKTLRNLAEEVIGTLSATA
ncbi:MAG: sigma-70 family RNA polymerase sigma factor [Candidatus Latescibacterota bacterium]|nr:sigma-70 family RNA polymerase sigma factor [Candidatus Latescibacterota bacterium]MEE2725476.1 sigma-70 family RNA polymerase sigma factor [Candidatus Latescibacterota bacterium]